MPDYLVSRPFVPPASPSHSIPLGPATRALEDMNARLERTLQRPKTVPAFEPEKYPEPERRPMTEAEETLIAAALALDGWIPEASGHREFLQAKMQVQRERTSQADIDAYLQAQAELKRARETFNSAAARVAPEIIEELKRRV